MLSPQRELPFRPDRGSPEQVFQRAEKRIADTDRLFPQRHCQIASRPRYIWFGNGWRSDELNHFGLLNATSRRLTVPPGLWRRNQGRDRHHRVDPADPGNRGPD